MKMSLDAAADLVWETKGIAEVIRRTPRQTHYLLSQGALPARIVGGRWVASRRALIECLTGSINKGAA